MSWSEKGCTAVAFRVPQPPHDVDLTNRHIGRPDGMRLPDRRAALNAGPMTGLDALAAVTPTWEWRPWQRADLPALQQLLAVCEEFDQLAERTSLEELTEHIEMSTVDPERDTLGAWAPDGTARAIARLTVGHGEGEVRNSWLGGAVHPVDRGRGIGRALLAWEIDRVLAVDAETRQPGHGPLRLRVFNDEKHDGERRLAARFGLDPMRWYVDMTRFLPVDEMLDATPPEGIAIIPWSDEHLEPARELRNAAFRDHWGSADMPADGWAESIASHAFRPAWTFLALDEATGQPVGLVLSCAWEQDWAPQGYTSGYVDTVGTRREARGRGVASALLRRAFVAYRDDGMEAARIGVDTENPTGALRLYRDLGFQPTDTTICLARDLPSPA